MIRCCERRRRRCCVWPSTPGGSTRRPTGPTRRTGRPTSWRRSREIPRRVPSRRAGTSSAATSTASSSCWRTAVARTWPTRPVARWRPPGGCRPCCQERPPRSPSRRLVTNRRGGWVTSAGRAASRCASMPTVRSSDCVTTTVGNSPRSMRRSAAWPSRPSTPRTSSAGTRPTTVRRCPRTSGGRGGTTPNPGSSTRTRCRAGGRRR